MPCLLPDQPRGHATRRVVEKSGIALAACCDVAAELDAEAVIVHVGSHLGDGLEAGLGRIQGELDKVLAEPARDLWLLLENTAGAGGTIGRTVDELAAVIERSPHPRLGVCLDSCHLFASGIEISDPAAMTACSTSSTRRSASTGCAPCT